MITKSTPNQRTDKLIELIKDIRIAMLTTALPDGTLRSRPMATQQADSDGDLWFFTQANVAKADEIRDNPHVNVSYSSPRDGRFVSVTGTATLVRDRRKVEELWDQLYEAWYPQGLQDPDLALLNVQVERAEYWDAASGTMAEIAGLLSLPGEDGTSAAGENEKIDLTANAAAWRPR